MTTTTATTTTTEKQAFTRIELFVERINDDFNFYFVFIRGLVS